MKTSPNIILINCDDLGYGDLGSYGSKRNDTPHIDALARGGVCLNEYYTGSPVCSASRASLMTGCYPPRVGFGKRPVLFPACEEGLNPDETCIARVFQRAGYATQAIGKWHCGDQPEFLPTNHGFDHYFGIPFSNDMGRQIRNDGSMLERSPLPLLRDETVIQQQPDQRGITERYTDEALQFIHRNQEQPFFLYLAHMYVHVPLFVPKPFLEASRNGAYGGAVAAIDWSTGVIVDCLKRLGLFENTIIVFTSDNGSRARDEGGSNEPLRGRKGQTWEGGQRVPCIFHWPEGIPSGRRLDGVSRTLDMLPTLAGLAGVDGSTRHPIDGVDLSERMRGTSDVHPNETFAYYLGESLQAVRVGPWKLHFAKGGAQNLEPCDALFHIGEEPAESNDRFAAEPEKVAELKQFADSIRADLGDTFTGVTGTGLRPGGFCQDARPLTEYDPDHPYIIACYDRADMPTMNG